MKRPKEIAEYVRWRDAELMKPDLDSFIRFAKRVNGTVFSDREAAEIAKHKLRTACLNLPRPMRQASRQWLIERDHESWDDGDLK